MNRRLSIALDATPDQARRLLALQAAFAEVCNALSPQVRATRCWNRVALHHMSYKALRERFPAMGSQMVCNAIYSVSRSARMVYQHPASPFNLAKLGSGPLPLLQFTETCPVYFDRHTLSLKQGQLSMYTLDGRMHFQINLGAEDQASFHTMKLREIVLARDAEGRFGLSFWFSDGIGEEGLAEQPAWAMEAGVQSSVASVLSLEIPEYLIVQEAA